MKMYSALPYGSRFQFQGRMFQKLSGAGAIEIGESFEIILFGEWQIVEVI